MKICFAIDYFNPDSGGPYTAVRDITNQLKNINIEYLIVDRKNFFIHKNKLHNYDIFHIFGGWSLFYIKIQLLATKLKKKIIIHPLGFYEPWSLDQKKIKKKIAWITYQKKFLLKADLIHCASINEEKNLLKLDNRFKTMVLPFGIDDKFFKKKINFKLRKKALFFSRLLISKGLLNLINAWIALDNKDWILDIIGDGVDKEIFKKIISENNFKNINLLKPIYNSYNKKKIFNYYNFFVLPTYNESFGIAILESLARGLPVLTTKNTPWNLIKKFNAGWIINNSNNDLQRTLTKIFNMPNKEFIIKSNNSIKLASKFRWSLLLNKYIQVYKDLIKPQKFF
jgi:glycosyltransferase involved in cell wall biosynthesis